jgi:hypothetical protein
MKISTAIAGGFAGATALTIIHQLLRFIHKDAPRMDLLGMEALAKGLLHANDTVRMIRHYTILLWPVT